MINLGTTKYENNSHFVGGNNRKNQIECLKKYKRLVLYYFFNQSNINTIYYVFLMRLLIFDSEYLEHF